MIGRTSAIGTLVMLAGLLSYSQAAADAARPAMAGPVNPRPGITLDDLTSRRSLEATLALTGEGVLMAQAEPRDLEMGADVYGYKPKSPRRAFIQSLLIPGWGQWYNGSRWKPFLFAGIEVAGWAGWSNFRSSGNEKEDEYRDFADAHWDSAAYFFGLKNIFPGDSIIFPANRPPDYTSNFPNDNRYLDTTKYIMREDQGLTLRVFSHHAYFDADGRRVEENTYYENIGKYDQFQYGWWGYTEDQEGDSLAGNANRLTYVRMRDQANREFNKASRVLILTMANHLVSAFEAALGAKRYNRALDQFGGIETELRLTNSTSVDRLSPTLTVRYRF